MYTHHPRARERKTFRNALASHPTFSSPREYEQKKNREHLKTYRLLYVILAVMFNDLILRLSKNEGLRSALSREKRTLFTEKAALKKTKNSLSLFFAPFPNAPPN